MRMNVKQKKKRMFSSKINDENKTKTKQNKC